MPSRFPEFLWELPLVSNAIVCSLLCLPFRWGFISLFFLFQRTNYSFHWLLVCFSCFHFTNFCSCFISFYAFGFHLFLYHFSILLKCNINLFIWAFSEVNLYCYSSFLGLLSVYLRDVGKICFHFYLVLWIFKISFSISSMIHSSFKKVFFSLYEVVHFWRVLFCFFFLLIWSLFNWG